MEVHCLCSSHASPLLLSCARTTLKKLTRDGQGCAGYDTKSDTKLVYPEPMRLEAPFRQSSAGGQPTRFLSLHLKGQPRTTVGVAWSQICKAAGTTNVRIHDLRHSYASYLVSSGVSLHVVGRLLGHSQAQTTQRYAHVAHQSLRDRQQSLWKHLPDCQ